MTLVANAVDAVMNHSRAAIAVMVVLTAIIGAGAPGVEQSSSLDQFQTESTAADKLDYIEANFSAGQSNTTTAQIIVRDDNVLDRSSLIGILRYQQRLRNDPQVNETLATDRPTASVANAIASAAIREEQVTALERNVTRLRELNTTITREREALRENRTALRNRSQELNATAQNLRAGLTFLRKNPDAEIRPVFEEVRANTSIALNETDFAIFRNATQELRSADSDEAVRAAYERGTRGVLADEYTALQNRKVALEEQADDLRTRVDRLRELADRVERQRSALRNASQPTLEAQIAQLRTMNESELDETIETVLGAKRGSETGVFVFMPTDYEPGSVKANATVLLVTQKSAVESGAPGAASESITDSQLRMETLADDAAGGEYLVFGAGIINDEISASQRDSLLIVGPLAVLFVLLALVVAYRDLLDILLGLIGIGIVLVWTFGFMGWAGIAFNQIFVAVPVLLIGLSIDYAIHVFMRHREEREGTADQRSGGEPRTDGGTSPRGAMRVALSGVGVALVWVTATTVIGFLSNLISPVPPIREFGIVSSFGIVAAFLVFAVLTPAVKVELDGVLESRGIDRRKRAFGTGGGAFSSLLAVGSTAARKGPYVVILLAILVTAAGAAGGSQVDTSFEQSDFLAEDPPSWMDRLPEPFRPSNYTAKSNLEYVNDNFVRQDSQAQILVEGEITQARTLERVAEAEQQAADKRVTQTLSTGAADITSPLTVMRSVAAGNESFNTTFTAADTDGDRVPDRNLKRVYDELYQVAPDRAARVIHREDGEYRALRIVVSVKGGATGEAITTQMRDVAEGLSGNGLQATATGTAVLNKIVQDQLLETVIESLIVTVVAVFAFLMLAYRVTEGSATLGAVTLLPVVLSVAWILGTMFLLGVPFNVLTGTITSLTVGLGVAYSIHLSERYTQELDRTQSVWIAMDRAVTGTGGALLGSAATTVGGFGVLTFAILPPLQQFGLITGLTIIYAFLAAVLVLPSLLVVWTRFAGPEWADTDEVNRAQAAAADDEGHAGGELTATRDIEYRYVTPGSSFTVTITLGGVDEKAVLRERAPTSGAEIIECEPEPVERASKEGMVYAIWDSPDEATLRYTVVVSDDAAADEALSFGGVVTTGHNEVSVAGQKTVEIVADVFERIFAEGRVTDADLRTARQRFVDGEFSKRQFERVYQAWLTDPSESAVRELTAGDSDETDN